MESKNTLINTPRELLLSSIGRWSLFTLLMFLTWMTSLGAEEYRTFKSNDGAELEAQIVSCSVGESVTLRRSDGRLFKDVPWSRFSSDDQSYMEKWAEAEAEKINRADLVEDARLKITVLKGIDDDFNEYGDIDDRVVEFEPKVIIESDELYRTFTGVKGVLVFVGHGYLKKDEYAVLSRQAFVLNLPANEKVRWTGKPFTCSYDPDYGGFEYAGYMLVLQNRSGEIIFRKASKTMWEKNAEKIITAKSKTGYSRDFTSEFKLRDTFGLSE